MRLFSKKSKRSPGAGTWPAEKWAGLLQSVALSAEMYCAKHAGAVGAARADAASHLNAGALLRARSSAEQALRDRARTRALGQVAALAGALRGRSVGLGRLGSLAEVGEPARTELVSLVWASGRVAVAPLTEAADLLRTRFPDEVDDVVRAQGQWPDFLDTRLYEALAPGPADPDLIEAELSAAVRDHPSPRQTHSPPPPPQRPRRALSDGFPGLALPDPPRPAASSVPSAPPLHPQPLLSPPARAARLPPPDGAPVPLPRPWERGPRVPLSVLGVARATVPPPPPGAPRRHPAQGAGGDVPAYARGFSDDDEILLQRYRDLLKA